MFGYTLKWNPSTRQHSFFSQYLVIRSACIGWLALIVQQRVITDVWVIHHLKQCYALNIHGTVASSSPSLHHVTMSQVFPRHVRERRLHPWHLVYILLICRWWKKSRSNSLCSCRSNLETFFDRHPTKCLTGYFQGVFRFIPAGKFASCPILNFGDKNYLTVPSCSA